MDQRLKYKTLIIKLLEENMGSSMLCDFLDTSPQAKGTKAKKNKWDYIKLENFCITKKKKPIKWKGKAQSTEWEMIFANHISDKELTSKISIELIKLNIKTATKITQLQNEQKENI